MFFACHFQEEHSSLDNKNYVESIFIVYRIKYQKIKIDLTSPLKNLDLMLNQLIGNLFIPCPMSTSHGRRLHRYYW